MLESIGVHVDQINEEFAILVLADEKDVIAYQLGDQIAPLFRRYL